MGGIYTFVGHARAPSELINLFPSLQSHTAKRDFFDFAIPSTHLLSLKDVVSLILLLNSGTVKDLSPVNYTGRCKITRAYVEES